MDNTTISSADGATHTKILATALAASVAVLLVAVMARTPAAGDTDARIQAAWPVMKGGEPVNISRNDITAIR